MRNECIRRPLHPTSGPFLPAEPTRARSKRIVCGVAIPLSRRVGYTTVHDEEDGPRDSRGWVVSYDTADLGGRLSGSEGQRR